MDKSVKAALVGCSDPLPAGEMNDVRKVKSLLEAEGFGTFLSPLLFSETAAAAEEKAEILNRCFRDPSVRFIFDVSGGDLANTVLPYLDFEAIRESRAQFYGFSDLTVIINAIIAKTGRTAVNYQIRNLVYGDSSAQLAFFRNKILTDSFSAEDLKPAFLRGKSMSGKVFGGNIRCFLKLAGTPYLPDADGGVLLLESLGGGVNQMVTAIEQYKQLGIIDRISGILLGTFTKMENEKQSPSIEELVLGMTPPRVAVAKTRFIGHGPDSRAIRLGSGICF